MPKNDQKLDTPRQRPVSCRSCRTRKLRCSRKAPCSNCVSRGIRCELETGIGHSGSSPRASESEIIERLDRLEKLLGTRKSEQEANGKQNPDRRKTDGPESQARLTSPPALSLQIQGLANDVAWLESICTNQGYMQGMMPSNKVVFRICPIQQITAAPLYIYQHESHSTTNSEPSRCIWLPQHAEANMLLAKYLRDVNHIHHITYAPSLPSMIEGVYTDLNQQGQIKPSHAILFLSIIAGATQAWVRRDCEHGLFSTSSEANGQARLWIQATQDVLDIVHRSTSVSIEGIQGIIIAGCALANLEPFSRECRSLYSMAILLARDLGLHRIDHPSNVDTANTAQAEVGRRVWWYLCAADWAIAARFTGVAQGVYSCHLRQMITKKPLHINDEDIFDGMSRVERPLSQPTTMSYSLQRIRLAEISRNIVDRTPLIMAPLGGPSHDDVTDIDTQLQMLINDMPPFFSMSKATLIETYELSPAQAVDIVHQRYMFCVLLYSQRCKLHLPYFTRGSADTTYSLSREICVKSACLIIQSESYLEDSGCCTATRFKFGGLLQAIFMASIVLLMDLCIDNSSPQHEKQRGEVAEAFRILEEAKNESENAAKFLDSLMHIVRKHKVPPPMPAPTQQFQLGGGSEQLQTTTSGEEACSIPDTQACSRASRASLCGAASGTLGVNNNSDINMTAEWSFHGEDLSSYFNDLAQTFEHGLDVGNFDWDNIFSGLESSSI